MVGERQRTVSSSIEADALGSRSSRRKLGRIPWIGNDSGSCRSSVTTNGLLLRWSRRELRHREFHGRLGRHGRVEIQMGSSPAHDWRIGFEEAIVGGRFLVVLIRRVGGTALLGCTLAAVTLGWCSDSRMGGLGIRASVVRNFLKSGVASASDRQTLGGCETVIVDCSAGGKQLLASLGDHLDGIRLDSHSIRRIKQARRRKGRGCHRRGRGDGRDSRRTGCRRQLRLLLLAKQGRRALNGRLHTEGFFGRQEWKRGIRMVVVRTR